MAKIGRKKQTEGDLRDLAELKKLLGDTAEEYSDTQIRRIQQDMFTLAEILLDFYLLKKQKRTRVRRNRVAGAFDSTDSERYDDTGSQP
ncbi:MAG: hypothetical protein ACE5JQ_00795 [Candidatus Methylomirabilales bacterium]